MNCRKCLALSSLIVIFLLNFCFFISVNIAGEDNTAITITGIITNLEKAKKYITNDSYLQIVFLPSDGKVSMRTDGQGRMTYDSELARIDIPSTGAFTFERVSLKPGRYIIQPSFLNPLV